MPEKIKRLPDTVIPVHYDLHLKTYITDGRNDNHFEGTVSIKVDVSILG